MKVKTLLTLAALATLTIGAGAQTPPKTATKPPTKSVPVRDPKTGRFVKKTTTKTTTTHTKTKKPGPARDPKTGRFIKKKA